MSKTNPKPYSEKGKIKKQLDFTQPLHSILKLAV